MQLPLSRRYYWILAATTLWLSATIAPALTQLWGSPWGALAYLFFHPVCHQLPERSFQLWGTQLAVCHRCLGIYVGFWLGVCWLPALYSYWRFLLRRPAWLILFGLPMIFNMLSSNSAPDRFLTGLIAGFPVAVLVVVAAEQFSNSRWRRSQ